MIAFGGREVREDLVMDALWPDASGDAAHRALSSALHRLRGLLGHEGAILRQDGHLSLDPRACWVDVRAIEHLLARPDGASDRERTVRAALDLYQGAFLDGEATEIPQAEALAVGLRRRLLRQITTVARHHESRDGSRAADWYEEGLRVDPCAEDLYRSLMTLHHRLGNRADVTDVYGRCRSALAARLGSTPSPETERIFRSLRPD